MQKATNLGNPHFRKQRHQNRDWGSDWDKLSEDRDWEVADTYPDDELRRPPSFHTRADHRGKGPRNWARSDEDLQEAVSEALYLSQEVDARGIEVEVKERVVILRGAVEDRKQKRAAEDCVEEVSGVIDVRNELKPAQRIDH